MHLERFMVTYQRSKTFGAITPRIWRDFAISYG